MSETRVFSSESAIKLFENKREQQGLICLMTLLQVVGNKMVYKITYKKV